MPAYAHSFNFTQKKWIDRMVELPERGMGWQLIDFTLTDDTVVERIFVFGCNQVVFRTDDRVFTEEEIVAAENSKS